MKKLGADADSYINHENNRDCVPLYLNILTQVFFVLVAN